MFMYRVAHADFDFSTPEELPLRTLWDIKFDLLVIMVSLKTLDYGKTLSYVRFIQAKFPTKLHLRKMSFKKVEILLKFGISNRLPRGVSTQYVRIIRNDGVGL